MSYLLITDDDIARYLSMPQALICMEESFRLHAADRLIAPARSDTDLNEAGKFVFTVGGSTGTDSLVGFRGPHPRRMSCPFSCCSRTTWCLGQGCLSTG